MPEGEALGSQAAVRLFYDMWLPSDLEGPESACTPGPSQEKGQEAGLKPPPSQGTPVQEGPLACLQSQQNTRRVPVPLGLSEDSGQPWGGTALTPILQRSRRGHGSAAGQVARGDGGTSLLQDRVGHAPSCPDSEARPWKLRKYPHHREAKGTETGLAMLGSGVLDTGSPDR